MRRKDSAPAIAVTDTNNLFGALEFAQKATKEGVQPIIGCQLDFSFAGRPARPTRAPARQGPGAFPAGPDRRQRGRLSQSGAAGQPRLSRNTSGERCTCRSKSCDGLADGIICLTGGPKGPIGRALKSDHPQLAEERLLSLKDAVRRPPLCRDRAPGRLRPRGRSRHDRSGLPARSAAGRHQRGVLPDARRLRRA